LFKLSRVVLWRLSDPFRLRLWCFLTRKVPDVEDPRAQFTLALVDRGGVELLDVDAWDDSESVPFLR
jgi:hypothetical protein